MQELKRYMNRKGINVGNRGLRIYAPTLKKL